MKMFYRLGRFCCKIYFLLFYHLTVYGTENIIPGKAIIASNHTSFLDPPMIAVCCPEEVYFLARKTLFSPFLLGSLLSKFNAFPVNGTTQDLSSIKLICKLLEEKKKVVIFPEGMRSPDGELQPFKTGFGMLAMRCRAPIIPVYLEGCYEIWNRKQRFPKLWGRAICKIGQPIYPEQYAHLEKKESYQAIAEQLKRSLERLKNEIH
jgi:1-acyl-sn-glycerol-3-phosphate acyltransferase